MISTKLENKPFCPQCKTTLDGAAHEDAKPRPGDANICCYCVAPLVFTENMSLVDMDMDKLSALDREHINGVIKMVKRINQDAKRRRNETPTHEKPLQRLPDEERCNGGLAGCSAHD